MPIDTESPACHVSTKVDPGHTHTICKVMERLAHWMLPFEGDVSSIKMTFFITNAWNLIVRPNDMQWQ